MTDTSLVQIKGIRDGLLVSLGEAGWPVLKIALMERIEQQPSFFQGARLALDVGNQELRVAELTALRNELSERGITLWAVLSSSSVTESTSQILGMATRIHKARPPEVQAAKGIDNESALWVNKTLRSGTRIEYAGHVIVFGDVNVGAEVVAGGNVIIWGRLRGVVHAGAQGNREAIVCALDLSPMQLRIADEIAIPPERSEKPQPEIVQLKNGRIEAEPWKSS